MTDTTHMRPTFRVEMLDDPADDSTTTVHLVRIMHGDQLRAELEAGRNMIDIQAQPFALTSLWVWAAMTRTHLTDLPWQQWKPLVAWIGKPPPAEVASLDPTQPAEPTPSP